MLGKRMYYAALILMISVSAFADQITFINGDRLTGNIKTMEDCNVILETELAGQVKIPLENIQTMSSDHPLELHLKDNSVLCQPVEQALPGMIKVPGLTDTLPLSNVTKINPEKPRWKGDFSTGITHASGNTNNESYAFSANLMKRTEQQRINFFGDAVRKKEENDDGEKFVSEDWWRAGGQYDYFFNSKLYLFGKTRYETDKIADLDQRLILGSGYGYQWLETHRTVFSTELGLSWIDEKYAHSDQDNSRLAAQVGYRFDHKFDEIFSFIHDLTYYPSTENVSDYYLTTTSELRAAISKHLFTNFRILFDYDATPAQDKGSSDLKYIFGAGVKF